MSNIQSIEVKFLRYLVSGESIKLNLAKSEAVQDFPEKLWKDYLALQAGVLNLSRIAQELLSKSSSVPEALGFYGDNHKYF